VNDVLTAPFAPEIAPAPVAYRFQFRGTGREFFRIWIVNFALTLITVGIYSAWAKVRTRRYFYSNTALAGHTFDYHASPKRILMGRVIALLLLVGYTVASKLPLYVWIPTFLLFVGVVPWLIVSSARFNARNTSYRNVRFEFVGDYLHALGAYVGIFVPVVLTLGFAWPMAHRERQYFYINNHKYGGKRFATEFSGSSIYAVYFEALLFLVACGLGLSLLVVFLGLSDTTRSLLTKISANRSIAGVTFLFAWMIAYTFIRADVFLLSINNMVLNGRFKFIAVHSPWKIVWLWASNLLLVLLTAGLLYPWARVRMTRYMVENVTILADSDFESFTSEVFAPQSAVGEEIAGFFDFDIGL